MFVQDPEFGEIVDFDSMRERIHEIYDHIHPEFNLLGVVHTLSRLSGDRPSMSIAIGASTLAYSLLVAAEEDELAADLKDKIFTLGWTEEHCGSDLLSIRTAAEPMSDDPEERMYHIRGRKWLINNSYHADYHVVVAKIDPTKSGPRSLSLFLVPRSSTKNWERLETHVLNRMVLTAFDIDGPGQLLGRAGRGLGIIQRMANISRPQCTYVGMRMVREALQATIDHLAQKKIFGQHPIAFSNVLRQLYQLVNRGAFYEFLLYRNVALGNGPFLQFYGTQLKSWLLLRINELLGENLLVAGSKGYLAESVIGRDAIDSFILPVFDGHYTINTLMTDKHARRYLTADNQGDVDGRLSDLRSEIFREQALGEIHMDVRTMRRPPFFDWADYLRRIDLPVDLPFEDVIGGAQALMNELDEKDLHREAEYRYKMGDLIHWLEAVVAAAEMWALSGVDAHVDTVIQHLNGAIDNFNAIVAEGNLSTPFLSPVRQRPLPPVDDPAAWLSDLLDVKRHIDSAAGTAHVPPMMADRPGRRPEGTQASA